ncbi:MAG: type IX secretion system periplasmic lipoprotein PorW/SprE [Mucilaginibacter sp.]
MKQVSLFQASKSLKFLFFSVIVIIAGCSLEKQSGFNRALQNLTAHYNILFNAKEIIRLKQISYASAYTDDYNELLSVYPDTAAHADTPDNDLEDAIAKANKIINFKEQSHYAGDAYLVLGKANYLEGNYFNAVEFLSYVTRSYPNRSDLTQDALAWKARALMYLAQLPQAKLVLDTAIQNIDSKKNRSLIADVYAAKLQYDINVQDYAPAEETARQAISFCSDESQRLRLTFILGQLQELNQKPGEAIKSYERVANSNVAFEMAFNASLNRIRIQAMNEGVKTTRTQRLLRLLKEPNNKEFKDQVYYQVAQLQLADKNMEGAIKSYKLSVSNSVHNQNQKGLSYLRLAQIHFDKADYLDAKNYYDSTLTSLPLNYPGYQSIKKISSNLQLLADRFKTIAREDTLQALAKMDEKTRLAAIDKMAIDKASEQQVITNSTTDVTETAATGPDQGRANTGNAFYFYNTNAVTRGYADFKRKWGNRKLEDNWRRSDRPNSDVTANSVNRQTTDPDAPITRQVNGKTAAFDAGYRRQLVQELPLTPELLAQSNARIYNALLDIGNFYRDILADKKEAISIYEQLLRRFPNDQNTPAVYYSLYRLYSDLDKTRSDQYKNLLLKDYAGTPFAKVISDPDYARKLDDAEAEFTRAYNRVFDLYARRQYKDVIAGIPRLIKQYPGNKFTAQLYYLKALAEGHGEKAAPFADSLQQIAKTFPDDPLVTPLIKQHLAYISANHAEIQTRNPVLAGDDPQQIPFTLDPALYEETAYRPAVDANAVYNQQAQVRIEREGQIAAGQLPDAPKIAPAAREQIRQANRASLPVQQMTKQAGLTSIFSMRDSTHYYFAVNVQSGTTNLSSTRFGFGQFNRVNYAGKPIKHQLLAIGADNQVIYVGRFYTQAEVKNYARQIVPLLPDIMKVPVDKYSFFIITQENLNKLADEKLLDSYLNYYRQNY